MLSNVPIVTLVAESMIHCSAPLCPHPWKGIDDAVKRYERGEEAEVSALRKANLEMRTSPYIITVVTRIYIRGMQMS